jgi:hypothetical protein
MLTGMPCKVFTINELTNENLWDEIVKAEK